MPRKNRRRKSAYLHKLGFDPRQYTAERKGGAPPGSPETVPRAIQRIAYENKPSLDRHKARQTPIAVRKAATSVRHDLRKAKRIMGVSTVSLASGPFQPMTSGAVPHRLEIWYADLGFHDGSSVQNGIRPVLIFSNDIHNEKAPIVTVIPMSSNTNRLYLPSHVLVESGQVELAEERRFFHAGVLFLEQITTIDKAQLLNRVGRLNDSALMDRLNEAVREHLMISTIPMAQHPQASTEEDVVTLSEFCALQTTTASTPPVLGSDKNE